MNLLDDYNIKYVLLLNMSYNDVVGYDDSDTHYLHAIAVAKEDTTVPYNLDCGVEVAPTSVEVGILDACKIICKARLLNMIATERFGPNAADWPHEQMHYA